MSQRGFSKELIAGIIVALFFAVALYLRVALPYGQVFVGGWIKFTGVDAYRQMCYIDSLVHNFPHLSSFNPYSIYPGGGETGGFLFFNYLLGFIIWLIGLGSPTQHTIDVVGAYFPAVLGALTVIPVYFIGKALFNRWAGVISAGLVAILPGEFLGRSILGFTDYHVFEVLSTTTAMMFLILAVKAARQKQLGFSHFNQRDWAVVIKPLIYSLFAGIFLGLYLLSWVGALLFVFIIFAYFVIQFIIDHLRGQSTDYLCLVGVVTLFIALVMFIPMFHQQVYLASLVIALLTPLVLGILSRFMASRKLKPVYYPLSLVGLGVVGLAIFYVVNPSLISAMLGRFGVLTRAGPWHTILEAQPILFPDGNFSFSVVWGNFTTGFFLSLASLGILIYFIIKRGEADKVLMVVWSLVILAVTLFMRRFAYYFAINVALLTGYLSWLVLQFAGFKKTAVKPVETPPERKKKAERKEKRKGGSRFTPNRATMAVAVIAVFFIVFFPNIGGAVNTASRAAFAPSNAWCESLSWMRDNTTEPFGDPDFYYELHAVPPPGEKYSPPETAYGVAAWWDNGYWITRIGHRIPNSNPGQFGARAVARLFTAQNTSLASKETEKLGARYIIIDYVTAIHKFHGVASWAGSSETEFFDVYYLPQDGKLEPVMLFHPAYYRSLAIRLYNLDGLRVIPEGSAVISYREGTTLDGISYKEITSAQRFPTYEEAEDFISEQGQGNYRIVSADPFVSPVPLPALGHYEQVYSSKDSIIMPSGSRIPEVKIFEFQTITPPSTPTLSSPANGALVSGTKVNFQWNAVAGATKYQLQIRKASDNSLFKKRVVGNVTSHIQFGFSNDGTEYKWRVRAGSDAGWDAWSKYKKFSNGGVK